MDETDDTSSNPKAEGHLPAAGEFDAANVPQDNPLTTDEEATKEPSDPGDNPQ